MKKSIFRIAILVGLLSLIFSSCEKEPIEPDKPEDNTIPSNNSCMEYVDIHSQVRFAKQIFFINDSEGWMLGSSKDQSAGNKILLHTTDGGENWSIINNDLGFGFAYGGNTTKFKFCFTDSNHGYFTVNLGTDLSLENEYYYTNDKGASWSPVPLPSDDEDVHEYYCMGTNSTQMVFTARVDPPSSNIPSYNALYFVSNNTHTIINEIEIFSPEEYRLIGRDIHFTDNGVINMQVKSVGTNLIYMAHSENNGASWTFTEIDHGMKALTYMEFPTDNIGYLPIDEIVYTTKQAFYKTTDGGATWVKKYIDADNGSNGLPITDFSFADENNGLAIRFLEEGIYKTTDGGDSWTRVACFTNEDYDFDIYTTPFSIAYPSVNNGILLTSWMDVDAEDTQDTYQNRVYFYKGEE